MKETKSSAVKKKEEALRSLRNFGSRLYGQMDEGEPGIPGITVTLEGVGSMSSGEDGYYLFDELNEGDYLDVCVTIDGLDPTTDLEYEVPLYDDPERRDFGFYLGFDTGEADGYTIGFWKNNLKKHIEHKRNGWQIERDDLIAYTNSIRFFALYPFSWFLPNCLRCPYGVFNWGGDFLEGLDYDDMMIKLAQQLLAAEYNFYNGAWIDGDELLTSLFLWVGEYMLVHPDEFTRDEMEYMKDWYDNYNNSHGGEFERP